MLKAHCVIFTQIDRYIDNLAHDKQKNKQNKQKNDVLAHMIEEMISLYVTVTSSQLIIISVVVALERMNY